VPHAAENLDTVRFDLHPRAAAIAQLTSLELMVYLFHVDGHARGQAFDYRDERATV
jgi:hypothetical protein